MRDGPEHELDLDGGQVPLLLVLDLVGHELGDPLPGRSPAGPQARVGQELVGEEEPRRARGRPDAVERGAHAVEEARLPVTGTVERVDVQRVQLLRELVVGGRQAAVDGAVVGDKVGLRKVRALG